MRSTGTRARKGRPDDETTDRDSSLSTKARDLLRDALETYQDLTLAEIAEERERTLVRSAGLTHDEVWRGRRVKKR